MPVEFESKILQFSKGDSHLTLYFQFVAVDGSRAGSGNLEILVNGGHVTSFVRDLGDQRFLASFVPHEEGSHLVEMTFNGEQVPGEYRLADF